MFCGLPKTGIVCLYSVVPAGGETELAELAKCFRNAGYDVREKPNATLDDLRSIPEDCSVFYFNTHGIYSTDKATNQKVFFALQTGTVYNPAVHGDDPDSALLGRADGTDVTGKTEKYLTISYKFIRKHWRFSDNSFVFINGCDAFCDAKGSDSIWRILINECNASVMAGWTLANVSNCASTNLYLFDRLLGSNFPMARQEFPPQRPFELDAVVHKLASLGMTDVLVNLEDGKQEHSLLRIEQSGRGDFGILAPSIEEVTIDESEKRLSISGYFGRDQEKLRIFVRETSEKQVSGGGVELFCEKSEDPREMKCTGLRDSGPGSAGYLVVAADYGNGVLVESNPVPITAWTGNLDFALIVPDKNPQGTVIGSITGEVFMRGDIHRPRKLPGGDLERRTCAFMSVCNPEKQPQYSGSGEYVNPKDGYKYAWKGSGAMDLPEKGVFAIWGWHRHMTDADHPKLFVDTLTTEGQVLVDVWNEKGEPLITDLMSPVNSVYLGYAKNPMPFILDFLQGSLAWSENGRNYEGSYDIPEKTVEGPLIYGIISAEDPVVLGRVHWTELKAKYAPDDSTPG